MSAANISCDGSDDDSRQLPVSAPDRRVNDRVV